MTLLVIISRISNDLRCKTFFTSSIQRIKCGRVIYLPTRYIEKIPNNSASLGLNALLNMIPEFPIHCVNAAQSSPVSHCILVIITATSRKAEIL